MYFSSKSFPNIFYEFPTFLKMDLLALCNISWNFELKKSEEPKKQYFRSNY